MRGSGSAPAATASRSDQAPAQQTAWPASVSPRGVARAQGAAPSRVEAVHLAAGATRAAGLAQVVGVGARRPRRSRRSRCRGECSAATPARAARSRAMPSASSRRRPGDPVGAAAPLELVEAAAARRRRWRRSACRSARRGSRARRSTRRARARPRRTAAPSASRARSRCRRGSTPELWPVWWAPSRSSRSSTQTLGPRSPRGSARGRPRGRGCPHRRPRCRIAQARIRLDTLLRCPRSRS